jgi:hypothetical protein
MIKRICGQKLQCFLKNTPKCVSILWFSQLQIHSNFYTSFKLLKFGHEVNIISINSFLSGSYLEHLKRKCISSSTSPELHCWQSLWCRGIPWYLLNYLQMMRGNSKLTYTPPELKVPYKLRYAVQGLHFLLVCAISFLWISWDLIHKASVNYRIR